MRRYFHSVLIGLVAIVFCGFYLNPNSNFLDKLKKEIALHNLQFPQEKVYIQIDKTIYKPGEDLWLNAFIVERATMAPTTISDILQVELIGPKGNVLNRKALFINEGSAPGDFDLSQFGVGGLYKIRAYTRWMKNFGEPSYFEKSIQIQHVITPKLLLKLDLDRESYLPGALVASDLMLKDLQNNPIKGAEVRFTVRLAGEALKFGQTTTNGQGKAELGFAIPADIDTTDGIIQVMVQYQGQEESIARSIPIVLDEIKVQFFPEGGQWVHNVHSVVAFKAVNEFGKAADLTGSIVTLDGTEVSRITSYHMGMGRFSLKPVPGNSYFLKLEGTNNDSLIPIPGPRSTGMVLNLRKQNSNNVTWTVHSPFETLSHLICRVNGKMVYGKDLNLSEGRNSVVVNTEDFPAGIAVFTLFDANQNPQCERLVFVNKSKRLYIELETDKGRYLPGEKIKLSIATSDKDNNPVSAKLSLGVVDDQLITFADDKQDHIISQFFLSSELKGEVQEANFYFDPEEPKSTQALDNLLLTQGWRGFAWQEIENGPHTTSYLPEKVKEIYGQLVDASGQGIKGEVTYYELGNKFRIKTISSMESGFFAFKNIDPQVSKLLLTKKPLRINLSTNRVASTGVWGESSPIPSASFVTALQQDTVRFSPNDIINREARFDLSLESDVSELSEVVITGYGIEAVSNLTGSVSHVRSSGVNLSPNLALSLQGRVAGIKIQPAPGVLGGSSHISLRGSSGIKNQNALYIVDGVVFGDNLNSNFSNHSFINPQNISSIHVIKGAEALALYGFRANNGVIIINTKNYGRYRYIPHKPLKERYNSIQLAPVNFAKARIFYVPPETKTKAVRSALQSTVYWNPTIITDSNGRASIEFYANEATSTFRITCEGISAAGLIGNSEVNYASTRPVSIQTKLPEFIGYEDQLKLPVVLTNVTARKISGGLDLTLPENLQVINGSKQLLIIPPKSTVTAYFLIKPKGKAGKYPIHIRFNSELYQDGVKDWLEVRPVGFPKYLSYSGSDLNNTFNVDISDHELGTLNANLKVFPDILSDLFTGSESLLREPHGCFEQVSSSNYPNVLALLHFKEKGVVEPQVEQKALKYINQAYKKLTSYEIKGGGFEWFGKPPAHEGLTAFGLLQFHEMKKVYDKVDSKMINKTRSWLLSRRDGNGGFKQHFGKYGFSAASSDVNNAYITYALIETGSLDVLEEYERASQEAWSSRDMYRLALMANAAAKLGHYDDYYRFTRYFENQTISGFDQLKSDHSIVRSSGKSLSIETIALWTLALISGKHPNSQLVDSCIKYMVSMRTSFGFGSTQATALGLKALTKYTEARRRVREDGEVQVYIDDQLVASKLYTKQDRGVIRLSGFAKNLTSNSTNKVVVKFAATKEPLPFTLDISYYNKTPLTDHQSAVQLTTNLAVTSMAVNDFARYTATIENQKDHALPMVVAKLSIPGGLNFQPWQLKELQEKGVFDYYELLDGALILYYREMAPEMTKAVHLDLKAEVPGNYQASASSAYLYYLDEYKSWAAGLHLLIE